MFHSCCGGGNVLLCRFPLFTSRHMKVVNTPADVILWELLKRSEDKGTVFTLTNENLEVHGFLYSVRLNGGKKTSSLFFKWSLSGEPLKPNHTRVLSSVQHCNTRRSPLQQSSTWRSALPSPAVRVHSCSSSSSWSSSMASIWVLEQTSLIGAESSPSTTSSLDISLFFCGDGGQERN